MRKKSRYRTDDYDAYDYPPNNDLEETPERESPNEIPADHPMIVSFCHLYDPADCQNNATDLLDMAALRMYFCAFQCSNGVDPIHGYLTRLSENGFEMSMTSFGTMAIPVRTHRHLLRELPPE